MPAYGALLRAVNVGGTGKLPMSELQAMCEAEGYAGVRTYIASGNVVFHTPLGEAQVKAALERRLQAYAGKPVRVLVRTAAELARIVAQPEVQARLTHLGLYPVEKSGPEALGALIRAELPRWKEIVRAAGIKAE